MVFEICEAEKGPARLGNTDFSMEPRPRKVMELARRPLAALPAVTGPGRLPGFNDR